MKTVAIAFSLACFVLLFLFLPIADASDITVDVYWTEGIMTLYTDGKWRCYSNITIQNTSEENVTVIWVWFNLINVTFVDETTEELDLSNNFTVNLRLQPGYRFTMGLNITEYGFEKEPRIFYTLVLSTFLEAELPVAFTIKIIPEFPSLIIISLFMIATLLAIIVYGRKQDKCMTSTA